MSGDTLQFEAEEAQAGRSARPKYDRWMHASVLVLEAAQQQLGAGSSYQLPLGTDCCLAESTARGFISFA
ncbi:hypothetical protein SNOG_15416 [Parastagonospora nodorum SN15]|uniref:Uncharacterized protein n=1 Tax=Phaeosphaeria nodorum (strain SN15 / ATCC MYA-4574 / FGSC 10173) TaxID=321614 RepID=Q0TY73_PHANO|nr:hypothetical protein SNOG_15416 [Parastagonospora nodorum SN15]EAT77081.1 hypothetical protein SNOG_15416 [Parastagonospora nodorum SN15]